LENYLEKVAFKVGSFAPDFVYVDGFSGPWKSEDETGEDTSFMIAIQKLRRVREGLAAIKKHPRIRCIFIEKDPEAFAALAKAVEQVKDMEVVLLPGEFEARIPDILRAIGKSFSLVFIDPTGWTGFGLKQITPLIQHQPGEVIINFMFDHINRFLDGDRADLATAFTALFGGAGWVGLAERENREAAILEFYMAQMRLFGSFSYVTSTRILKPLSDRTYFHLVYGTRHPDGIIVFRGVEKSMIAQQERLRPEAQQVDRVTRTRQPELFGGVEMGAPSPFEKDRALALKAARAGLDAMIDADPRLPYKQILVRLLLAPLVWESDIKGMIKEMREKGALKITGLEGRAWVPKPDSYLIRHP